MVAGEVTINEISKHKHAVRGCFNIAYESNNKVSFADD